MELQIVNKNRLTHQKKDSIISSAVIKQEQDNSNPFIEANTKQVSLSHLKEDCIVPVFCKDNEITISHNQFINSSLSAVLNSLGNIETMKPEIRVSHQIKGRTPDAIHIAAKELQEHQRTIYYERMAWIARIPSITETINGNSLSLCIGGVRSYNHENLYTKKSMEKFKFFIGFQNMVCCNLCISTDGFKSELKASSPDELAEKVYELVSNFQAEKHLEEMKQLANYSLTEQQFAQLIGKSKLYHYLPKKEKSILPELLLTDYHFSTIAKDYFTDDSFCKNKEGNISLWNVYNLFTGANKSSYINTFLDRNVNAFNFIEGVSKALNGDSNYHWFLS
jgi:Domain of unknown function, B. Theta Gene description (DUF3871)